MPNLKGGILFNTQPFIADGAQHWLTWTNPVEPVYIKRLTITMGVDSGGRCDFQSIVQRASDQDIMALVGWDRYAEPTGSISSVHVFTPDYFFLVPGDSVQLAYFAKGFSAPIPNAHVVVNWSYTLEP